MECVVREITDILLYTIILNTDILRRRQNCQGETMNHKGLVCACFGLDMVGHRLDLHRLGSELCCLSRYDRTLAHADTLYGNQRGHQSMASILLILSTNTHRLVFTDLWNERKTAEVAFSLLGS